MSLASTFLRLRVLSKVITCIIVVFAFVGCSTPSQPAAMEPPAVRVSTKNARTISLRVSGGSETSALHRSQISNEDLAEAVRQSVTKSELFSKVAQEGATSDYALEAFIARLSQPTMGGSLQVTLEINWKLTRLASNSVVWEKAVTSNYKTTAMESFAFVKRLRLANEAAARANISDAISQMGALTLP